MAFNIKADNLTRKETELIKIIRYKNYSTVRIRKNNGEVSLVYAERYKTNTDNPSEKDLIKVLSSRDFKDMSIVKRDGKIVNYKIEETIKL